MSISEIAQANAAALIRRTLKAAERGLWDVVPFFSRSKRTPVDRTIFSDREFVHYAFRTFAPELVGAIKSILVAQYAAVQRKDNNLEHYLPEDVWILIFRMMGETTQNAFEPSLF